MFTLQAASGHRRGVILLVVVSLLTLFAIVGLSFVLYAEAAARSAQFARLAETRDRPEVEAELLLKFFLGQFLYGTEDVFSAMRGHSLAENMYGYNNTRGAHNTTPYTGIGRFNYRYPRGAPVPRALWSQENFALVNYTAFGTVDNPTPFIRDPERFGLRGTPEHAKYVCGSVPYTYPDANNLYLGAADADGNVLARSFHRDWASGNPDEPDTLQGFGPLWVNGRPSDNWTLADPSLKYKTLRPRPAEHRGFPPPEDAGGDVKNLAGLPGPNDSIWIDLNFPVQRTPEGRKYKPLFAAFIEDLDNRVNVNVHGNIRGTGGGWDWPNAPAGGHQAWGPWEVNLEHAIKLANNTSPEARNILIGNGLVKGRYEVRYPPEELNRLTGFWGDNNFRMLLRRLPFGPFYSRTNADGNPHGAGEENAIRLPGGTPVGGEWHRHHSFPHYTGAYANGDQGTEARNNPAMFNFFDPSYTSYRSTGFQALDDRVFPHSNLEALLRYQDTGSPAQTSDLFLLCPGSFAHARTRRLVSTIGFDVGRPGVIPGEWSQLDPFTNPVPYQFHEGSPYPTSPSIERPPQPLPPAATLGEFGADWRATSASLGRINLNRLLPDYPRPDAVSKRIADPGSFHLAQQARQEFALELFNALIKVTGAYNPDRYTPPRLRAPDTPELDALRWLAQLAVNIVDFIDKDDYMTPFNWGGRVGSPLFQESYAAEWVYGTELPRLVLNEVYAVAEDERRYRFWIELHNPLREHPSENMDDNGTPYLIEHGLARLQIPDQGASQGWGAYQLQIAANPVPNGQELSRRENTLGTIDPENVRRTISNFRHSGGPPPVLQGDELNVVRPVRLYPVPPMPPPRPRPPLDPNLRDGDPLPGFFGGNEGYYLIGPIDNLPGEGDGFPSLRVEHLEYVDQENPGIPQRPHTIVLRRLACPHKPPLDDRSSPDYNPYITVDYLGNVPSATPAQPFYSVRPQPYAATPLGRLNSHRFFQVNLPGQRFAWLLHHDRPLINALELLDVSAFKPHELTQQFQGANGAFGHRAPWTDSGSRLYRLLEFLEGGEVLQGVTTNGRAIGKLNVNTIWDKETFLALVNRKAINRFTDLEVDAVWNRMIDSRTPQVVNGQRRPGPNDRPFLPFAAPHVRNADGSITDGVDSTLLRSGLFQVNTGGEPNDHPYFRNELLRKVLSNSTTRSNVFGVWLTVGFFEVIDDRDKTRPPELGAELGRAENRHVRHRMFAIVDRTNLTVSPAALASGGSYPLAPGPRPFFMNTDSPVNAPGETQVSVPRTSARYEDFSYELTAGQRLVIDVGPRQEAITITPNPPAAITAAFTKRHHASVPLSNVWFPQPGQMLPRAPYGQLTILGNPGPQPRFDPRDPAYAGVVRYMSVIVP